MKSEANDTFITYAAQSNNITLSRLTSYNANLLVALH